MTHTPGPWEYEQNMRGDGAPLPGYYIFGENWNPDKEPAIAEVWTLDDARLIAASLDLLEALQELEVEATKLGNALSAKGNGATILGMKCLRARRAIAKAEGRD